jgi:DeoR family transcriptional regulator, fructose operon transcriptional repressor
LFAAQRVKIIKDFLLKNESVDITTLTNMLDVSDVTARKDLEKLEKEGFLIRNHGGAIITKAQKKQTNSVSLSELTIRNYAEKEQISELAYTLIDDGDIIFLGPGTTCYLFAKKLKSKKNITVVTNNINAIQELYPYVSKIIIIGGEVLQDSGTLFSAGQSTDENLKGIYVNKSFLSIEGVDLMAGFTVNYLSLSSILKQILSISKHTIFLADHTKFDKIGYYQISPIDSPECIVTNERLGDTYKQYFYEKNIKVLTTFDL